MERDTKVFFEIASIVTPRDPTRSPVAMTIEDDHLVTGTETPGAGSMLGLLLVQGHETTGFREGFDVEPWNRHLLTVIDPQ